MDLYFVVPILPVSPVSFCNITSMIFLSKNDSQRLWLRPVLQPKGDNFWVGPWNLYDIDIDIDIDNIYSTYSNWLHIVFMQHNHLKKKII